MKAKHNRIISIQVCRGFAAILVVLAHLYNVELKYSSTHIMRIFQYGVLGVDLFFVISGIVIAYVTFDKIGKASYARTFISDRFARVYPIYWIYTTIILIAFLYNPNWINARAGHKVNIVASYLLLPTHSPMLVMQAWTLSFEIYFYLTIGLLILVASQRSIAWVLAGWAFIVIVISTRFDFSASPLPQLLFNPLVLEFLAGFAIYYVYRRTTQHKAIGFALVGIALCWLFAIIAYNGGMQKWDASLIEDNAWMRTALYGSFAAIFVYGALELERSGVIRNLQFLEAIGNWSYSIYLSHIIVIELVGRTAFHFVKSPNASIIIIDLIAIPLVLLVGYLSYSLIEKPLMKGYKSRTIRTGTASQDREAPLLHEH